MRLRKLALAVGLASALGTEVASALGLGEIKLNSTLNQPLDAEIRLLQVRDLTPEEILVALASREDFTRAGVERPFFLTGLKFSVKLDGPDGPKVRVTSRKPVREPYLNFLVETQWPSGRLLREYTLLMDLPVFSDERAAPVTRAARQEPETQARQPDYQQPQQTVSRQPAQESAPSDPAPRQTSRQPQYGQSGEVYGPVGASDTLWEIALKARPSRQYSVQQTMLAIQRLNPEAFINGNINLLRKGQVLRLPKADQIDGLSERQAVNEVAFQNTQWSGDPNGRVSGPQLEAGKRLAERSEERQTVEGRLKLASGGADGAEAGRADGAEGGDVDALQNELAISLEELDRSRRENTELKDRVAELEDQISTMERLVEVSNEQLRALQLAAEQGDQQLAEAASQIETADAEAEVPITSEPEAADAETDLADQAAEASPAPVTEPAAQVKKPDPSKNVVVSSKPAEKSFIDTLLDNILLVGAGLLAIIGAAVVFLRRRSEREEEQALESSLDRLPEEDNFESPFADDEVEETETLALDDELESDELELPLDDGEEEESLLGDELDFDDAGATGEAETDDAVGEADIYIAYGKLDQAEDMLLKAIDSDPGNTAARLKLMEVYLEGNNLSAFDQQYAQVQGDAVAAERAGELRSQFAGAPAFDASAVEESVQESTEDAPLDFDEPAADDELSLDDSLLGDDLSLDDIALDDTELNDSALDESVLEGENADAQADDDLSLDFDLGDLDAASDDAVSEEAADDLGELSLDLDLTDLDAEPPADDGALDLDFDLGDDATEESDATEEFSLDLDTDTATEQAEAQDDDLAIDFDLGDVESQTDDTDGGFELDLDLDAEPEATAEEEGGLSLDLGEDEIPALDDAVSLDDELSLDLPEDVPVLEPEAPAVEAEATETEAAADEFDMDLDSLDSGDMDLAALDEEVDALAGNLDLASEEFGDEFGDEAAEPVDLGAANLSLDDALALDDSLETEASEDSVELADEAPLMEEPLSDFGDLSLEEPAAEEDVPAMEFDAGAESLDDFSLDLSEELSDTEAPAEEALVENTEAEAATEEEPEFDIAADLGIDLDAEPEAETEDDVFDAALSDIPTSDAEDLAADDIMDEDLDAELDFLADTDEAATKLDLARAYIDMGDKDGAKDILGEVVAEGNADQKKDAEELLSRIN